MFDANVKLFKLFGYQFHKFYKNQAKRLLLTFTDWNEWCKTLSVAISKQINVSSLIIAEAHKTRLSTTKLGTT